MDFISEFTLSDTKHDAVLVVAEKLSKRAIFIPAKKTITSMEVMQVLFGLVFSKHGMPKTIIFDRDKLFTLHYFNDTTWILNVELNMASKGHPKRDGQSEKMSRTFSTMIRSTFQKNPLKQDNMFSELEFHYNSSMNKITVLSPYEVDIGRIPETEHSRKL